MRIFDRLASAEGFMQLLERLLRWGGPVAGTALTSWFGAWAVSATDALNAYAPASWAFAGLVSGCAFIFFFWLWTVARVNVARVEFEKDRATPRSSINSVGAIFTTQKIFIEEFRNPFNEPVVGKTFIDCEIIGPALVILRGKSSLTGVNIGNCEFVRVKDKFFSPNALPLVDVTIKGGKFRALTLLVPESAVALVNNGVSGIEWITH